MERRRVERAFFGFGSFWGTETVFRHRDGVIATRVGYMGGHVDDPSPDLVASNETGHAEVVEVTVDPEATSFEALLDIFWAAHDPTVVPRGAPLERHRFRPVCFCESEAQLKVAVERLAAEQSRYRRPLVTTVAMASRFWPAPNDQQRYLERLGMYVDQLQRSVDLGLDLSPPHPGHEPMALDRALVAEFGGAVGVPFGAENRLAVTSGDFDTAAGSLRRWLTRRGPVEQPEGFDDDENPPPNVHPTNWEYRGRHGLMSCGVEIDRGAALVEFHVSALGRAWLFVVTHTPGSGSSRHGHGRNVDMRAQPHAFDNRVDVFSGGGGGSVHAIFASDATPRGPAEVLDAPMVRTSDAWHAHVPRRGLDIRCGAAGVHALDFSEGRLTHVRAEDAVEREQVMSVLAGRGCLCELVRRMWHPNWVVQHGIGRMSNMHQQMYGMAMYRPAYDDLGRSPYLTAAVRVSAERDLGGAIPDLDERVASDVEVTAANNRFSRMQSFWPPGLKIRWFLGVLAALDAEREELDRFGRWNLDEGLFLPLRACVLASVWQWLRLEPTVRYGEFDLQHLEAGEEPFVEGSVDGEMATMTVGVPFRWLTHVWARGLALVDGHLVLRVEGPPDAARLDGLVAEWQPIGAADTPRLVSRRACIEWDGDGWHLQPSG